MEYFVGLHVSMEETSWTGTVQSSRGEGTVYAVRHRSRTGRGAGLSTGRVRDRPHGPDAPSRPNRTRRAGCLYREPAGLAGAEVAGDPQDRRNDARGLAH